MIVNLTLKSATHDQITIGVVDLPSRERAALDRALTFKEPPTVNLIRDRAERIAMLAIHNGLGGQDEDPIPLYALIDGPPWMITALVDALIDAGILPMFAFKEDGRHSATLIEASA